MDGTSVVRLQQRYGPCEPPWIAESRHPTKENTLHHSFEKSIPASSLCPIILDLRVWWHRPSHQLSKASSQRDRVPFALLSIKAWHHRFLPRPFLPHAPEEPLGYVSGHFERQWIMPWPHPTNIKQIVTFFSFFNSIVANYTLGIILLHLINDILYRKSPTKPAHLHVSVRIGASFNQSLNNI